MNVKIGSKFNDKLMYLAVVDVEEDDSVDKVDHRGVTAQKKKIYIFCPCVWYMAGWVRFH